MGNLFTPPGRYTMFSSQLDVLGTVNVYADGTWQFRGRNGTSNNGRWGDVAGLTHFLNAAGKTVAKRSPHEQCHYDATGPWIKLDLNDVGQMSKE